MLTRKRRSINVLEYASIASLSGCLALDLFVLALMCRGFFDYSSISLITQLA